MNTRPHKLSILNKQYDPTSKRKLYVQTWGCQMNTYDSERIIELLQMHGYTLCDNALDSDLVIFNTCHIREKAAEKIYSEIGRLQAKRRRSKQVSHHISKQLLAIGGCVAQAEGQAIITRAPSVDLVFGPQNYHRLPEMLAKIDRGEAKKLVSTDFPKDDKFDTLDNNRARSATSAFLTIQEGCDKFCSFCVVPYTRGSEMSRNPEFLIDEARSLIQHGAAKITLLGQNVNAWRGIDKKGCQWSFADLLFAIADLKDLSYLTYTTSHPREMSDDLIAAHRDIKKLIPWLHLPVQSGSDKILKSMNRQYTSDEYLTIINKLRDARADMAFSSDFIVGFPGESDQDFADTISLIRQVKYASAYSFNYSPRPGTPASAMLEQVDKSICDERLQSLQQLLDTQQQAFNHTILGKTIPVLIEDKVKEGKQFRGRSPWMQPVHFDINQTNLHLQIGQTVDLQIDRLKGYSFFASMPDNHLSKSINKQDTTCNTLHTKA